MRYFPLLRGALIGLLAAGAAPAFALSGSGDSGPGDLDTVAPTAGTATVPGTGLTTEPLAIPYAGASDTSGIARVELWSRTDAGNWGFSALFETTAAGSFDFMAGGTGTYHFDLVAEDTLGNRSAAPSGGSGVGQGTAVFSSNLADWTVLE